MTAGGACADADTAASPSTLNERHDMNDREQLIQIVANEAVWGDRVPHVADAVLGSDWLAQHDAEVRTAERERIAQAIEAMSIVDRLTRDAVRRFEPKQVRANAARIARTEGDPA